MTAKQDRIQRNQRQKYTYRITDQDYNNRWTPTYKGALAIKKQMYKDGAERVSIAKEFLS